MKRNVIKVGYCVAYDWELLKKSIPRIYNHADLICLSIDRSRISWTGKKYNFDENAFQNFLLAIDSDQKIDVYEDDFYNPLLSALENDNRQRNMMAKHMGEGGWHIQIDADEYFLDFEGFTQYLKLINPIPTVADKPINISVNLIPLIKKDINGYIFVDFGKKLFETAPFATNLPIYSAARRNGHFNHISPYIALHETWSRSEEELLLKISNWGHDNDFINKESFFKLWQALDSYNYRFIKNFHPLQPEVWPALGFCKGKDIEELISNFEAPKYPLSNFQLYWKNNRNIARLKAALFKSY